MEVGLAIFAFNDLDIDLFLTDSRPDVLNDLFIGWKGAG